MKWLKMKDILRVYPYLIGVGVSCWFQSLTLAQVIPDNTLGGESSQITNIDQLRERIDGGAIRGGNLFHSFLEFNVGEGRGVYFSNPAGIANILSRVTGGNASHILGQLGVLGNANLFLLNPNGIIFGQNASLDIQGSFHASTAEGIKLGEQGFFNAIEPQKSSLLSVDPGVLLFNQAANHSGSIINRGNLAVGGDLNFTAGNLDLQGQLYSGRNLTLKGLNTVQLRETVTNPFVAAAMGNLLIQGNETVDIFVLNHPNSGLFSGQDLVLRSANTVIGDAHYYSGGNFSIEKLDGNLNNLSSPNDPVIRSLGDVFIGAYQGASLHIIAGGSVNIPDFIVITGADPIFGLQETITLTNGQEILIDGQNTPTVDIRAGVSPEFIGFPPFQGSGNDFFFPPTFLSESPTSADINIGTIIFSRNIADGTQKITGDVLLTNQYQPNPSLEGSIILNPSNPSFQFTAIDTSSLTDGGRVIIDSKGNTIVIGAINSFAFGQNGKGGDVFLNSVDDISLISSNIRVIGSQGGNITLNANNIDILTSLLQSGIGEGLGFENAQAGDIRLNANETILIDSSLIANGVLSNAFGNAGDTVINTSNLFLTNGTQLNSNTAGFGDAGAIKITATGEILIAGESPILGTSAIVSQVEETGIGNSQGIEITTNRLTLTDGANIDSSTFGRGNAGLINIKANDSINIAGESSLSLDIVQSGITSQVSDTGVGNSQGIIINTPNLNLKDGGRIDATTFGRGNAGRIQITAPNGNILLTGESLSGQVSTISSQVQGINSEGNSGGIVINTSNLILENGAGIDGNTSGIGNAGLIDITANSGIIISGEDKMGSRQSGIFSQVNFFGEEIGIGNSEGITINTSALTIQDGGSISASTFSLGNSGEIKITATDNITISGASLRGFNSNISSQVRGQAEGNSGGIVINTPQLKLENGGAIDASTEAIGNTGLIEINAQEIILTGKSNQGSNSIIGSAVEARGIGNSEGIIINSDSLSLQDGASISASSLSSGNAGDITLNINNSISISGRFFSKVVNRNLGGIEAFTSSTGSAGNITINTPQLTLFDGAGIEAFTSGEGNAGDITINAPESIILNTDTRLITESSSAGTAANININTPLLTIGENAQLSATATPTSTAETAGNINLNVNQLNISGELGIFAETQSTPTAGTLTLQPYQTNPNLNIQFTDNGFISARTTNIGDGGSIFITAPDNIDIRGQGSITAETTGSGDAGNINFNSQTLTIADGTTITTSTESLGNAGIITFNVAESIFLTNQTRISSEVRQSAQGNSQGIIINTPSLTLNDNARISAATEGLGNAGDIDISNAETITIDNNSLLNVQTDSSGIAGNINLTTNTLTIGKDSELSARSTINATGTAGNITINADFLNITGELGIFAETNGIADAGNLNINPNETLNLAITFFDEGQISASTSSAGEGGDINLNAPQTIDIRGIGQITVQTSGTGNAGEIDITTQNLTLAEGLEISASTIGDGSAGNINLNANQHIFDNATINSFTNGNGNAGSIRIANQENNAQSITLNNNSQISTEIQENGNADPNLPSNITLQTDNLTINNSRITTAIEAEGKGTAGSITVPDANNITLNNSEITASTSGEGDTGEINLNANETITLNNSQINSAVQENAIGNSQEISLNTANFEANNSTVSAATAGQGNAGSITVENAQNTNLNNSRISTAIAPSGVADQPSNITLNTQQLTLDNSSEITASTQGTGNAGSITVPNAQNISLNSSEITASTSGEGDTGEINLNANETVTLNNSNINSAVQENAIGNSQQITLNTPNLNLNTSEISAATAGEGNAGSITVENAQNTNLNNSTISTAIAPSGTADQPSNITLNTQQLTLDNSSEITASTQGTGNAGSITVPNAQNISLNSSEITASTSGEGDTGEINLNANETVTLNNSNINSAVQENAIGNSQQITLNTPNLNLNTSEISAATAGEGNAGSITVENAQNTNLNNSTISTAIAPSGTADQPSNITLNTQQLNLDNDSEITASTSGKGDAGSITIPNTNNITLNNSEITASTSGEGDTGEINLNANETITLNNSEINSSVQENAIGNSQQITLNTPNLNLNESEILAATAGEGNAGSITVKNAQNTNLNNSRISTAIVPSGVADQPSNITLNTQQLTLDNNSEITASTEGKGDAGSITVPNADTVSLDNNSQISASTSGEGDAGEISIKAQTLTLDNNSIISTTVEPNATGQGGNINIETTGNSVTLNNRSQISSRSQGEGDAGNINISSQGQITLNNSDITTASDQASGGEITISGSNILLQGDSDVRTNVNSGAGGGGNINFFANVILAFDDSDILAFARDGRGGNITLNTPIFFGDGFQEISSRINVDNLDGNNRVDVNASGAISGSIIVPDITFIRNSLTELPQNIIDTENLIANSCVVPNRSQTGTFIITGSGGLPVRPGDVSGSTYSTGEVRTLEDDNNQYWQPGDSIVEPQGVYRLPNGKLVLSRECQSDE